MRLLICLALALLAGCSSVPPSIDGQGAVACVRVETLTTSTTTVYIAAGQGGAFMVHPDCTMAVQLQPKGMGL